MTRLTPLAVATLAVLVVAAPLAAAAPSAGPASILDQETETPTPDGNASVAPGAQLSGVVGVQGAEIRGEVDERTFDVKVERATGPTEKAAVVAGQVEDVTQRVEALQQRKATLEQARSNGTISEGEYRARMATVAAELSTARRLANASETTARGLPAEALAAKGVDVSAIQALQARAGNLTGPEVAEIARSIAGTDVGRSMGGPPASAGPEAPNGPPNGTDAGAPNDPNDERSNATVGSPNATDSPVYDGED